MERQVLRVPGWLGLVIWLVVAVLSFDWWWWGEGEPLIGGWLPFWALYQMVMQAVAILLLIVFVVRCWPGTVPEAGSTAGSTPDGGDDG